MIRILMSFALGLGVLGFSAASALAGPEDVSKEDIQKISDNFDKLRKDLAGLVEAHNKLVKGLESDQALTQTDIKNLEKKTTDAITDLNKRIDDLNKRIDKLGQPGRNAYSIDPTMARLNLRNRWDLMVTFTVNGRAYVVAPQQDLAIDVPAGDVVYQIVGDGYGVIDPLKTIKVSQGQALNMEVFRR
jgi:prefoldin subunit 5